MRNTRHLALLLATLLLLFAAAPACLANAAEPPSITIITQNPPEDLELTLTIGDQTLETRTVDKVLETYYSFYYVGMHTKGDYRITMTLGEEKSMLLLDTPPQRYNNIYTLDWEKGTLKSGKAPLRDVKMVSIRVLATLLIEAFVFLLFGFREYRSWTLFVFINLITQGALNVFLNRQSLLGGYIIFGLIFGEIFVYLAETGAFLRLVKEKSRLRTVLYVLVANTASLLAGIWLIGRLPL